jgi:hypothetical protein
VVKVETTQIQVKERKIRVREGLTETEIQELQNRSRTHRSD